MKDAAQPDRPITLLICALGGEGGGVLVEWLVRTATACGYAVQSTSIPGVAQRTGSTTYYIEIYPVPLAQLGGREPVFSLYPVPGALDVLVSSEMLETARQIGNGMVSPERTRVLTSTSRTLTTSEKMQLGDGRAPAHELLEMVQRFSLAHHAMDLSALAREAGTVVSAVLLGAIAGSGWLPLPRAAYEETVRQSERGAAASLKGFAQAFDAISRTGGEAAPVAAVTRPVMPVSAEPEQVAKFPASVRDVIARGCRRLMEYQNSAYAELYLQRLQRVLDAEQHADPAGEHDHSAMQEAARYLALWMAYDDIARVADLKSRPERWARVREEVKAAPEELLRVYDFFKPGVPEFAALLPARLAQVLQRWDRRRIEAGKSPVALPLRVGTHSVSGYLMLRLLSSLRVVRKHGSRYAVEQAMIERWLGAIEQGLRGDWQVGYELAQCGRLIKGYGTTNERGKENLLHVLEQIVPAAFDNARQRAGAIRDARLAALEDDSGKALDRSLLQHGLAARPVKAQPIVWMKKPRRSVP